MIDIGTDGNTVIRTTRTDKKFVHQRDPCRDVALLRLYTPKITTKKLNIGTDGNTVIRTTRTDKKFVHQRDPCRDVALLRLYTPKITTKKPDSEPYCNG